jgi:hypothetical protein
MELLKALWNVVKAIANVFVVLYNYIKPAIIKFIKHKPEQQSQIMAENAASVVQPVSTVDPTAPISVVETPAQQ